MKLLTEIEKNIEGKNRATKIRKCLKVGYEHLTSKPVKEGKAIPPSLMT